MADVVKVIEPVTGIVVTVPAGSVQAGAWKPVPVKRTAKKSEKKDD